MVKHTITNTKKLTSDGIYKICSAMLNREQTNHEEPPIANEYVKRAKPLDLSEYIWVISHDILCILYGELNASKAHKIMGIPVYDNKETTRFIMLGQNNTVIAGRGEVYFKNNLSDKETLYVKNDINAFKIALNSAYGIINAKPKIKKVIFNDPATIIFWSDRTKTVVKAGDEPFDPEKGMAMAISKKMFGNEGRYYETFKKWLPKEDSTEYVNLPIFSKEEIKTIQKGYPEGLHPGAIKMTDTLRTAFPRTKGGDHNE